jgi:exopolyphosphatase/guanosine-5'-triphosphate,3'-diphosphate pyrophosphatase
MESRIRMNSFLTEYKGRVVGFLDIGTHSIRLLLVRNIPNRSRRIITQQKEVVRLGEGEFNDRLLKEDAMRRAVLVCQKFSAMLKEYGANPIIAVATSATRDALNQTEFLHRLQTEADLSVTVISGREEARLIYLGITSGSNLGEHNAVFIDIGGGSTELTVGNQQQYYQLDSLKLGAIRLSQLFLENHETPVPLGLYENIQNHIRHTAIRTYQRFRNYPAKLAIGSSGTIETLAELASKMLWKRHSKKEDLFTHSQIKQVIIHLCSLSLEERRRIDGINPERADIIIGGAAILDTVMEDLGLTHLQISDRGLRDGLWLDYLIRHDQLHQGSSLREQSILQLGRDCHFNETHAVKVAEIALQLFDSIRGAGIWKFDDPEREWLRYAALLHDIGSFLSYHDHHQHSFYLIRNADLLGFNQSEIAVIALTAMYHRKGLPRKKHGDFFELDKSTQKTVTALSLLLRIAESLERSHNGAVKRVRFSKDPVQGIILEIEASQDIQLEIWGLQKHQKAFYELLKEDFTIKVLSSTITLHG